MRAIAIGLIFLLIMLGCPTPVRADRVDRSLVDRSTELWKGSVHALNDVNCSSCHQDPQTKAFVAQPDRENCRSCHEQAVETFLLGKHGIRLLEGETPLTPTIARLPMQPTAHNLPMTCATCHDAHSVKTVPAAVDACLTCHADRHSLNYQNSRHGELFASDRALPRPSKTAVSCATCHLPRHQVKTGDRPVTLVNHNNTYTLLPRDRMVKEVCMNCHGVEYSYNSIFDDDLVETNFDKPPKLSLETFKLMRELEAKRSN
jgi:hypothetical protein